MKRKFLLMVDAAIDLSYQIKLLVSTESSEREVTVDGRLVDLDALSDSRCLLFRSICKLG